MAEMTVIFVNGAPLGNAILRVRKTAQSENDAASGEAIERYFARSSFLGESPNESRSCQARSFMRSANATLSKKVRISTIGAKIVGFLISSPRLAGTLAPLSP